jgi:hypothetical protein
VARDFPRVPPAMAAPFELAKGSGGDKIVAILGAELLDTCVVKPDIDLPVSRDNLAASRDMLSKFGDLTTSERDGKTDCVYRNCVGRAASRCARRSAHVWSGRWEVCADQREK